VSTDHRGSGDIGAEASVYSIFRSSCHNVLKLEPNIANAISTFFYAFGLRGIVLGVFFRD
jgi:hypothetical protein